MLLTILINTTNDTYYNNTNTTNNDNNDNDDDDDNNNNNNNNDNDNHNDNDNNDNDHNNNNNNNNNNINYYNNYKQNHDHVHICHHGYDRTDMYKTDEVYVFDATNLIKKSQFNSEGEGDCNKNVTKSLLIWNLIEIQLNIIQIMKCITIV